MQGRMNCSVWRCLSREKCWIWFFSFFFLSSHERTRQTGHRSFFVIVGDRAREQIVNIHYLLSKAAVKTRPSVLWCYKTELDFSVNKQKRLKKMKVKLLGQSNCQLGSQSFNILQKQAQRGLLDPNKSDTFELFVSSTNIRYCFCELCCWLVSSLWTDKFFQTRTHKRFWETHLECSSCKTLSPSHPMCLRVPLKLLKEVDAFCFFCGFVAVGCFCM